MPKSFGYNTFHASKVSVWMACELHALGYEAHCFESMGEPYVTFTLA